MLSNHTRNRNVATAFEITNRAKTEFFFVTQNPILEILLYIGPALLHGSRKAAAAPTIGLVINDMSDNLSVLSLRLQYIPDYVFNISEAPTALGTWWSDQPSDAKALLSRVWRQTNRLHFHGLLPSIDFPRLGAAGRVPDCLAFTCY